MNEWFKPWFASRYYHLLYRDRDEGEGKKLITNLLSFLQPQPDAHFLDAPCGTGRHAIHLSDAGFRVTGIDLSEPSIQTARLSVPGVEFQVHDMRQVFLPNRYDCILNLFTSFGYFDPEANATMLQSLEHGLKQNGTLLLDFLNTDKVLRNLRPYDECTVKDITFKTSRSVENGVIVKRIEVNDAGKVFRFSEHVQAISIQGFKDYLAASNLQITRIFGDYDLGDYDPNSSERMLIVANRRG